jgi:glycosyltransferase
MPLCGHLYPLVPLSWALRAAGHEVIVAAPSSFLGEVTAAGLSPVPSSGPLSFEDFMFRDRFGQPVTPPADPAERRLSSGRAWGRAAAHILPGLSTIVEGWRPDIIIAEPTEFAAKIAGATHGIPVIEHWWGLAVQDEYACGANAELYPELRASGLDELPQAALHIDVCPGSLQRPGVQVAQPVRYVPYNGPSAHTPMLPPRTPGRPRISLTMGSVLPVHGLLDFSGMLRDFAVSLAGTGAEVIVAVDPAVAGRWTGLPDTVLAGWNPLKQVLSSCDLIVHHAGPGSAFTAMTFGVPQLGLPQTADQFENAARFTEAGVGRQLLPAERNPESVAAAAAEILGSPDYATAAAALAAENATRPTPSELVTALNGFAADEAPVQP